MKIDHFSISVDTIVYTRQHIEIKEKASFILIFTSRTLLESPGWLALVFEKYPNVPVISCSTSGEIYESELQEESISCLAIELEKTAVHISTEQVPEGADSLRSGESLGSQLSARKGLKHAVVFSDGWQVNGSELITGMYKNLPEGATVSGGLAGDGANFSKTLVGLNDIIRQGMAVAIGLYGSKLEVGFGAHGGWNEMGESLTVTQAKAREIMSLDGKNALTLYKQFLGKDASGLPGTALLYPLAVNLPGADGTVVRTVYNVDELDGTISLGEPVPIGATVKFMRAKFNDLLKGVELAAVEAKKSIKAEAQLGLIVSCIGRKLLFDKRIEEEIAITQKALGSQAVMGGFYSYGEICPDKKSLAELHHQMLTVTLFAETD
jgi:hypothetical protein